MVIFWHNCIQGLHEIRCQCTNTAMAFKYMKMYLVGWLMCVQSWCQAHKRSSLTGEVKSLLCKSKSRNCGIDMCHNVQHKNTKDIWQIFGQNMAFLEVGNPWTISSMDNQRKRGVSPFSLRSNTVHSVLHKSTLFCPHFTTDRLHSL